MPGGTVLSVENNAARVEVALKTGLLACPHCDGELRPWGRARRRVLRLVDGVQEHQPRRSRCSSCGRTSVLLCDQALVRRVDEARLIGEALVQKAAGAGARAIAAGLCRPRETVRGWLQAFARRAEALAAHFRAWAFCLDARLESIEENQSPVAQAVEAIGLATRAASILLGPRPAWSWAAAMTGGALLANTSSPFPSPA